MRDNGDSLLKAVGMRGTRALSRTSRQLRFEYAAFPLTIRDPYLYGLRREILRDPCITSAIALRLEVHERCAWDLFPTSRKRWAPQQYSWAHEPAIFKSLSNLQVLHLWLRASRNRGGRKENDPFSEQETTPEMRAWEHRICERISRVRPDLVVKCEYAWI